MNDFEKFIYKNNYSDLDPSIQKRKWYRANDLSRCSKETQESVRKDKNYGKIPNYILIDKYKKVYYTVDKDGKRHYTELGNKLQSEKTRKVNHARSSKIPFGYCSQEEFPDKVMDFIEFYHIQEPYDYFKIKKLYREVNRVRNYNKEILNDEDYGKIPIWKIKAKLRKKVPNKEFKKEWDEYRRKFNLKIPFKDIERLDQNIKIKEYVESHKMYNKIPNFRIKIEYISNFLRNTEFYPEDENFFKAYSLFNRSKSIQNLKPHLEFCKKCNKITKHFGIMCQPCHVRECINIPNFETRNNVLFYKNMEWNYFCQLLDSGELNPNDYPGIEKRLGVWTYNRIDPLSNEPILFNKDFILRDNVLFYKNTTWEEYKLSFIVKPQLSVEQLSKELNGFIQSTFRSQESLYWENRSAFEKDLEDKNIGWFVYIKFYIDRLNKESKPLVVGKTGTKLVSNSNTDISFDYEEDYDGCKRPARIFLKEEGFDWNKIFILIIPCENEEKALSKEKEIQKFYNLFTM